MNTYTELEVITYNAILDVCGEDYAASINDIVNAIGESASVLRGVLSSLIKKDKITQEDLDGMNVFMPCEDGVCYCYGGDALDNEKIALFVKLTA